MDWDHLRIFVVLAREQTLAAASRRLGVDQTTVARRLYALEESLGAALFERGEGRWRLTPFGQGTLERAERMEEDVAGIARLAEVDAATVSGIVRITCVAATSSEYLVHRLPELYARYPELVVELIDTDANLNIARHEADIAIRASRPMSGDFIIRKLAVIGFAVYESARMEVDSTRDWVCYNDDLMHLPEMQWLEANMGDGRIRLRNSGLATLCGAIAGGVGRGILPCFIGDVREDLRRSLPRDPVLSRDSWMLFHREARKSARVAAVADWLVERLAADAAMLSGVGGPTQPPPRKSKKSPGM